LKAKYQIRWHIGYFNLFHTTEDYCLWQKKDFYFLQADSNWFKKLSYWE